MQARNNRPPICQRNSGEPGVEPLAMSLYSSRHLARSPVMDTIVRGRLQVSVKAATPRESARIAIERVVTVQATGHRRRTGRTRAGESSSIIASEEIVVW